MVKFRINFIAAVSALLLFSTCKKTIKPEVLYGKWNYIKVENLSSNPPDSVKRYELDADEAHIVFSKNDSLHIWWARRVLSKGTFKIEGDNIKFKEILPDGKTREFPFFVSEMTDKKIIFATGGEDGSTVTAVKQ